MKNCVLFVVLFYLVLYFAFGQVAEEIAVPYIEEKGILSDCTNEPMTYEAFYKAVEAAFPNAEIPFEAGPEQVLRKDFVVNLVKIIDAEEEAMSFNGDYT